MTKKILCALLALFMLALPACSSKENMDENTTEATVAETASNTEAEEETEYVAPPDDTPVKETLTDTDTPDKSTKLAVSFDSYDRINNKFIIAGGIGMLYDGDINTRLSYKPNVEKTHFNACALSRSSTITAVKLFCAANYNRNIGLKLQAKTLDGDGWVTLYTLTEADATALQNGPLVVNITDTEAYKFFRIVQENNMNGYDLNEVELYGVLPDDGLSGTGAVSVAVDSNSASAVSVSKAFDGDINTGAWAYPETNVESTWFIGKLSTPSKIGKITIGVSEGEQKNASRNLGLEIQLSVDKTTWTTVYKITNNDVTHLKEESQTLDITVPAQYAATEYEYVRVYQTNVNGRASWVLSEIMLFKSDSDTGTEPNPGTSTNLKKINTTFLASTLDGKTYQVFDGLTDKGSSAFTSDHDSLYVSASFKAASKVSAIRITQHPNPSVDANYNKGLKIQLSADNEKWDTVITITDAEVKYLQNDNSFEVSVPDEYADIEYSYIRIYQENGVWDDDSCRYAVGELEAFAPDEGSAKE